MITTELLTDRDDINQIVPASLALAEKSGASLPFQFMHMPLIWWETFQHAQNTLFGQKRGKSFLGVQCRLEKLSVLIAREGETLCGVVPLTTYAVKVTAEQGELHIMTLVGDYVLHPFQDFVVDNVHRQNILAAMLAHITDLLKNESMIFWAGYIPEDSPNSKVLRDICNALNDQNMQYIETISAQKGGVWPWTMDGIRGALEKISANCEITGEPVQGLAELKAEFAECTAQSLLFPRTRSKFLQELQELLPRVRMPGSQGDLAERLESFLKNTPMLYPYINLPEDREEYLASLSYSTRRYFRRYMKKFYEAGGHFETVLPHEITDSDIEDYIRLHLLRWGKDSAAICGESSEYHRKISKAMAQRGMFLLFFARYQDKRIAVHSCFDIGARREGYVTGLDPEYNELRAGRLLYLHTIYDAIDKGFSRYELGAVGFDYKMSFVEKSSFAHSFFIYPAGKKFNLDQIFLGFECMMPVS